MAGGELAAGVTGYARFRRCPDFFDDTGVLDEPSGRIGFILLNSMEAAALEELSQVLDEAISGTGTSDAEITRSAGWDRVVAAARHALAVLSEEC